MYKRVDETVRARPDKVLRCTKCEDARLTALRAPRMHASTEGKPVVWLPFSGYELANLKAMLGAALAPGPLSVFDSGDWIHVLECRFQLAAERFAAHERPNKTPEQYRSEARTKVDERFVRFVKGIAEGYDHEDDAHRHQNGACRSCNAEKLLVDLAE